MFKSFLEACAYVFVPLSICALAYALFVRLIVPTHDLICKLFPSKLPLTYRNRDYSKF